MRHAIYLLVIVILFSLTTGLFAQLGAFHAIPNLVVLFAVVMALEKGSLDFVLVALVGGLMLDFYSGLMVGSFSLSLLLTGFLLQFIVNNILVEEVHWYSMLALAIGSVALIYGFVYGYNFMFYKFQAAGFYIDNGMFGKPFLVLLAYNSLLIYPVYVVAEYIRNVVANYEIKKHRY